MASAKILVSNDDSVHAPGIEALAAALSPLGEVWVVAPAREQSASSHKISLHDPLRLYELGERKFAVDGTPADCVYMGLNEILPEPPDIVVSGINAGPNLGNDIMYSGTVAAAMEGVLLGYPGIAASLCLPENRSGGWAPVRADFEVAAEYVAELAHAVLKKPMQAGTLLNVNVPFLPKDELQGVKLSRLGYTDWAQSVTKREDPRGRPYYWIGGVREGLDHIPDSDNKAISERCISLTPIHFDMTYQAAFPYVRSLELESFSLVADGLGEGSFELTEPRRSTKVQGNNSE
ncbi:MAG: 5'/3'-nucleotidase SurE [Myxococcales bacterium]|nr:5'/3'-nucleotidase SurE [Myxococcales bacterium]